MPLQAQQIVSLAVQNARARSFLSQAGQLLNMILADLADTQDLDLCRGTYTFTLTPDNGTGNGAGPYQMPADYKRAVKDGFFYTIQGVPYQMVNIDQAEYDALVVTAGLNNFPTVFYVDISPQGQIPEAQPNLYVWEPSNGAYPATMRYHRLLADITTPESSAVIPWFPNQEYLLKQLTGLLCLLTDDDRAQTLLADDPNGMGGPAQLRRFMQMTNDDAGRAKTVTLDRRRFGPTWGNLKSTKLVGW